MTAGKDSAPASPDPIDNDLEPAAPDLDPTDVAAYLRANPDYLKENPDLLGVLSPPSRWEDTTEEDGGVVDMQVFMLDRIKRESENLRDVAREVVATTRANMSVQTRTHAAVIAMLNADSFESFAHVVRLDLPLLLDVDAAALCFESAVGDETVFESSDIRQVPVGAVDHLLENAECEAKLFEETGDDGTVFGEAAGLIASAAIARLRPSTVTPQGMLALGARHAGTFHPTQGTDLLLFLARVTQHCLDRWLAPTS